MSQLNYLPYEDWRVCAQNSHSGTSSPGARARGRSSLATIFKFFLFHILAHSFALFCAPEKLNSFIFKRFRTLLKKNGGVGEGQVASRKWHELLSLHPYFITSLFPLPSGNSI